MSIEATSVSYTDRIGLTGISGAFRVDGIPSMTVPEARALAAGLTVVCDHIETSWAYREARP